jgi:hypothetical protein
MNSRRKRKIRRTATIAVIVTGSLVGGCILALWRHERNLTIAENAMYRGAAVLITALDAYHTDHGRFPDTLAELAPGYLTTVPAPNKHFGTWGYEIDPGGVEYGFRFGDRTSSEPSYRYDSETRTWSGDTK